MYLVCFKWFNYDSCKDFKKTLSNFCLKTDTYIRKFFQKHNRRKYDFYNYNLKIIGYF